MRHFAESRLLPLVGSANHSDEGTGQDDVRNFSGNPLKLTQPARSTLNPQPSSHPLPLKTRPQASGESRFQLIMGTTGARSPRLAAPGCAPSLREADCGGQSEAGAARARRSGAHAVAGGGSSADPGGNRGFWPWRGARLRVLESPRGPCALTLDVPRRGLAPSPLPVPNDDGRAALVEATSLRKS